MPHDTIAEKKGMVQSYRLRLDWACDWEVFCFELLKRWGSKKTKNWTGLMVAMVTKMGKGMSWPG